MASDSGQDQQSPGQSKSGNVLSIIGSAIGFGKSKQQPKQNQSNQQNQVNQQNQSNQQNLIQNQIQQHQKSGQTGQFLFKIQNAQQQQQGMQQQQQTILV